VTRSNRVHVLGIVGSPRHGGNTEALVDEALAGAAEAGASTEKVMLERLDIGPCSACDACQETGECVLADDMPALLEKMARSTVWVLGTPVYWWGPTAQFKTFLDRWYSKIFLPADRAMFQGRRVVLVIPLGDTDAQVARHTVGMLTDALKYTQARLLATVLAPGVNGAGEVRGHPDILATARRAGRAAVEE
jgi:multimeric flavodoxin WrbA